MTSATRGQPNASKQDHLPLKPLKAMEVLLENVFVTLASMSLYISGRGICLNVTNSANDYPTLPSIVSYGILVLSLVLVRLLCHPRPLSSNHKTFFLMATVLIPDVLSFACYRPALHYFEQKCVAGVTGFYGGAAVAMDWWELFALKWITSTCFSLGPAMILVIVQLSIFWLFLYCLFLLSKLRKILLIKELQGLINRAEKEKPREEQKQHKGNDDKDDEDDDVDDGLIRAEIYERLRLRGSPELDTKLVILTAQPKRKQKKRHLVQLIEESQC